MTGRECAEDWDRSNHISALNDAIEAVRRADALYTAACRQAPGARRLHDRVRKAIEAGRALPRGDWMPASDTERACEHADWKSASEVRQRARDILATLGDISDLVSRPALARLELGLLVARGRVTQQRIACALAASLDKSIDVRTIRRLQTLATTAQRGRGYCLPKFALPPKTKKFLRRKRDILRRVAQLASTHHRVT